MELNQIKYFLNLAKTLNFTEAARLSGISQPSLTKSIRRLEDELGAQLLYRDGKDTRLTALGRDLKVELTRIDMSLQAIKELAALSIAGRSVVLTIGIATTVAPRSMASFWNMVLCQLPTVDLVFEPLLPKEGEREVLSGKYDLCILPQQPAPNFKLDVVSLFEEHVKIAMGKDYALAGLSEITPQQVSHEPYLDRIHCEFRSQIVNEFNDQHVVMRPRVQSEREDWVQSLVADGVGITAMPEFSAIVGGIVMRPVVGLNLKRDVSMVAVSGSGTPREVRQVLALARQHDWSMPSHDG